MTSVLLLLFDEAASSLFLTACYFCKILTLLVVSPGKSNIKLAALAWFSMTELDWTTIELVASIARTNEKVVLTISQSEICRIERMHKSGREDRIMCYQSRGKHSTDRRGFSSRKNYGRGKMKTISAGGAEGIVTYSHKNWRKESLRTAIKTGDLLLIIPFRFWNDGWQDRNVSACDRGRSGHDQSIVWL